METEFKPHQPSKGAHMSATLYKNNPNTALTGSTTLMTQDTFTITGGTVANGDTLRIGRLDTRANGGAPANIVNSIQLVGVDGSSNPVTVNVQAETTANSFKGCESLYAIHFLNGGNQVSSNTSQPGGFGISGAVAVTSILDPTQNITVNFNTQLNNAGDTSTYVGGYIEQL